MKIGIDVDDVLGCLCEPFLEWYNSRTGSHFHIEDVIVPKLEDVLPVSSEELSILFIEYFDQHTLNMPKTAGSSEAIDCFKSFGDTIYVITARPITCQAVTNRWISDQYGQAFEKVYFTQETPGRTKDLKAKKCSQHNLDAMIEDNHSNAEACAEGGRTSFLLRYPWNQVPGNYAPITPVGHWHHGYHNGWQEIIEWRLGQEKLEKLRSETK